MKKTTLALGLAALGLSAASQAHFQLLYTPESQLEAPTTLDMKLVFGHPMENGHVMNMDQPEEFFVTFKGDKTDLKDKLKKITWSGHDNKADAFQVEYKVRRNGDYIFTLVPAPYYEAGEDIYIQQITKRYINKGAMPTGWEEPLGLKTEIVPKNKPYQIFTGSTFTGQLLSSGKPAAGVECEIEFVNTEVDTKANGFGKGTFRDVPASAMVAITDDNGMFTFGIPAAGKWGFACLGSGPDTEFKGKELSQDAVIWIEAKDL
ncbi:DUF4198 domain-containing protein [Vibrio gazogenes]|uniref:Cobalt/nickel transport protein n=1 Tax=Vibrio gazogenes DSM 21264 = NBRC 103151 TaxID=1123492 RepID=A0A1M5C4F3_VIBGA|nr:DUF4198 domain-containing protein [Vibrio gazogenes]USP15374.1 DUF4198 domain-containing protein [Vibrio gazogenes]SHF49653.1 cobalt/nickel transport protein [Vibrio gazogenes DSM 21264] [Vibrio gazogenes DSM 21264 = NBRC 103151]